MSRRHDRDRMRPALRLIAGTPELSLVPEPAPPCEAGTDVQLLIFAADGTVLAEAYIADIAPLGPDAWQMRAVISGPRSTFGLAPLSDLMPAPANDSAGSPLCPPSERGQDPDRHTRPGQPVGPAPAGRLTPSGSTHRKDES